MAKQWVQHISGQGEKWEVLSEESRHWRTKDGGIFMWLPKSEYRLCDPPEVWRDVTAECEVDEPNNLCHGYRLRKVQLQDLIQDSFSHAKWAFIVEQKVSQ